jgi:hypothetical protein
MEFPFGRTRDVMAAEAGIQDAPALAAPVRSAVTGSPAFAGNDSNV